MRQRRWLKFLKDHDFGLNYHPSKADVMADALSKKYLHMSMLMVRNLDLLEQFRDTSLVCEVTSSGVKLGMLKLTSGILYEIREVQKSYLSLVDRFTLINQGRGGDFWINENGIMRYCDGVCVSDMSGLKNRNLDEGHRSGLRHRVAVKRIVDRLTKFSHFIPIRMDYPMEILVKLYVESIVYLHGILSSIVSDIDPSLTSRF
ncbi:uncharacterized protein LOC131651131 [Vicia villosa]|uniref:uncharacterized protein LOC131651131 n=1 Tax=Vicia villosa TaxID=3911 RepID=UPI00273B3041|nr:uncharacterized protein LOC131651131 [Vicia villosa]